VLRGRSAAAWCVEALLSHGRSGDEWMRRSGCDAAAPAHPARHARRAEGQLATADSKEPAILVVGAVAGLRDHLRWFDERPLFGKRVVVTRSREQAGELVELLEDLGADPIEAPTIRIVPPADFVELDEACAGAGTFDWIIFTSANGVDAFIRRLLAGSCDIRDLKGPRLCAIGPATADRLSHYGIKVDLMLVEYRIEAIIEALGTAGESKAAAFSSRMQKWRVRCSPRNCAAPEQPCRK